MPLQRRSALALALAPAAALLLGACGGSHAPPLSASGVRGSSTPARAGTFDRPGPPPVAPRFEVGRLPNQLAVPGGSPPVRLSVPATGVETPLLRLGLEPDRSMEVPGDFDLAG